MPDSEAANVHTTGAEPVEQGHPASPDEPVEGEIAACPNCGSTKIDRWHSEPVRYPKGQLVYDDDGELQFEFDSAGAAQIDPNGVGGDFDRYRCAGCDSELVEFWDSQAAKAILRVNSVAETRPKEIAHDRWPSTMEIWPWPGDREVSAAYAKLCDAIIALGFDLEAAEQRRLAPLPRQGRVEHDRRGAILHLEDVGALDGVGHWAGLRSLCRDAGLSYWADDDGDCGYAGSEVYWHPGMSGEGELSRLGDGSRALSHTDYETLRERYQDDDGRFARALAAFFALNTVDPPSPDERLLGAIGGYEDAPPGKEPSR